MTQPFYHLKCPLANRGLVECTRQILPPSFPRLQGIRLNEVKELEAFLNYHADPYIPGVIPVLTRDKRTQTDPTMTQVIPYQFPTAISRGAQETSQSSKTFPTNNVFV